MQPSNLLPCAWALALLLSACASTRVSGDAAVRDLVNHGRFDEAVREADRLRKDHPGDAEFEALHREATIAWILAKGRQETLKDNDLEALGLFHQALQIDPASVETAMWIDKTVRKMSRIWLERGLELHATGKLEEAIEAYSKALEYVPGDLSALNGMGEAVIQVNYREGMGQEYFQEGLHALSEYWLEQARSRFSYSEKYKPEEEKTGQRRGQVDALLAQQRVTVAHGIEASGRFAAARNEFRLAAALDPKNQEAKEGFERCSKESKAFEILGQAKMEIVRGRMEHALALIEEGERLTTAQKELFQGARDQIEQRGYEELYQIGLARERELEYEAAVATYTELLSKAEYYKDVLARKDMLVEYIRLAAELYAQAQAATDEQQKLEALRKISVFWPEYKDVAEQLRLLEKP
ncbi:MAG: tetratricopeptide repeat protein [Planctomycetota bacterium]